jgi:hypothetical protein
MPAHRTSGPGPTDPGPTDPGPTGPGPGSRSVLRTPASEPVHHAHATGRTEPAFGRITATTDDAAGLTGTGPGVVGAVAAAFVAVLVAVLAPAGPAVASGMPHLPSPAARSPAAQDRPGLPPPASRPSHGVPATDRRVGTDPADPHRRSRLAGSTTVASRHGFGWPLAGLPGVLRGFDPPDRPYGPGHRGVDLGGAAGQPVLAAAAGVVVFAGDVAGRPVISVDHPNGLRTTYEPVAATVTPGERVARGHRLGTLRPGHPGCPAAACLHWGVRRGTQYLDPLRLLSATPVRLLPTT